MAKLTLSDLANLENQTSAVTTINTNNQRIEDALENTLSRDGTTPNQMNADIDMNSNEILNLGDLDMNNHRISGLPEAVADDEPVRFGDIEDLITTLTEDIHTGPQGPQGPAGDVPSTRLITAGTGLSGGGSLAADRTISLDTASTRNTDHAGVSISAGAGLSGGGDISATRTLSLDTTSVRNKNHPASTTDNTVARYDGTGGDIQSSGVAIDDSNNVSGLNNLTIGNYEDLPEIAAPATPSANFVRLYAKDKAGVSTLYYKQDNGTEVEIGASTLPAGTVLQVLQTTYTTNTALATTIPADDTTPTSTEGVQILSQAITPASSSNKILCLVTVWGRADGSGGNGNSMTASLLRSTTTINAQNTTTGLVDSGSGNIQVILSMSITHLDSPATTSSTTYSVRVGGESTPIRLNGTTSGRLFGGTATCSLTLIEVKG